MLPNLLATPRGRLLAFFALYITEGIPLGLAAKTLANELRTQGVGPAEVGAFVGLIYLPWAFKWMAGPLVDVFRSRIWGHRRAWILGTQLAMVATVLLLIPIPLKEHLALFSALLFVHNLCCAVQDVAIDGLAVQTLPPAERGFANGLMFAGAAIGQFFGGELVLFLMGAGMPLQGGFIVSALCILLVTTLVVLPMKESLRDAPLAPSGWREAGAQMKAFSVDVFGAFMRRRGAFAGIGFSLLPAGAMGMSLALQSTLAVELGMSKTQVAALGTWSVAINAVSMAAGGWLSDRFGHLRSLAVYFLLMSAPPLYMAWALLGQGYVMPVAPGTLAANPVLIHALWVATLSFNVFMGFMYGTRSAVMMNVTDPRVGGTQFTAYMALANLAIATTATWQGIAIEAWGYPVTLMLDASVGLLCVALLPFIRASRPGEDEGSDAAARRARGLTATLALLVLGWALWLALPELGGKARPIVNTLYSLVFMAGALLLLAAQALGEGGMLARWRGWIALALVLMAARGLIGKALAALGWQALPGVVPLLQGVALLLGALALAELARARWVSLDPSAAAAPASSSSLATA